MTKHLASEIANDLGVLGEVDTTLEAIAKVANTTTSSVDLRLDDKLFSSVLGLQIMSSLLSFGGSCGESPGLSLDAKLIQEALALILMKIQEPSRNSRCQE